MTVRRRGANTVAGAILPASPGWTRNALAGLRPQQGQRPKLARSTKEGHLCARAMHFVPMVVVVDPGIGRVHMLRRPMSVWLDVMMHMLFVGTVRMGMPRIRKRFCMMRQVVMIG